MSSSSSKNISRNCGIGANKARSLRHAKQRKCYQLDFHQQQQHQSAHAEEEDGYFCITETKLASGKQMTFASKWQVHFPQREPLHHSQRPAKSILRRCFQAKPATTVSLQDEGFPEQQQQHKVRFAHRNDQRFYKKGSASSQQLVKIRRRRTNSNEETKPTTDHLVDIVASSSSSSDDDGDSHQTTTIQEIQEAIHGGQPVQDIIDLLQQHEVLCPDAQDNPDSWLATLYNDVKVQLQAAANSSETDNSNNKNLKQIKNLLTICKAAESAIVSSRALKQWSRFQVTVESISNLHTLHDEGNDNDTEEAPLQVMADMYHSSSKVPRCQLGPSTNVAAFLDPATGQQKKKGSSPKYCLNHNFGLADEKPELTFTLSSSDGGNNAEQQQLGQVRFPCALFRFFSTQPKETYSLDQRLVLPQDSGKSNSNVRVKFSIQKVPLKQDFLTKKRNDIATKLQTVLEWIQRFNKENKGSEGVFLSSRMVDTSNVSLLHAAILVQDRHLVQQVLALGGNPFHDASSCVVGSPMNLALNMMDRFHHDAEQQEVIVGMIHDMQQQHWSQRRYPTSIGGGGAQTDETPKNTEHRYTPAATLIDEDSVDATGTQEIVEANAKGRCRSKSKSRRSKSRSRTTQDPRREPPGGDSDEDTQSSEEGTEKENRGRRKGKKHHHGGRHHRSKSSRRRSHSKSSRSKSTRPLTARIQDKGIIRAV